MIDPFDFVAQVSVRGIDAIAALLHARPTATVELPHVIGPVLVDDRRRPKEIVEPVHTGVRAYVRAQLGPPGFSIGPAETLRIVTDFRAHVEDVGGAARLPGALHGRLRIEVPLRVRPVAGGDLFGADFSSAALAVGFDPAPGSPISAADRTLVERAARNYMRANLTSGGVLAKRAEIGGGRRLGPLRADLHAPSGSLRVAGTLDGRDLPGAALAAVPSLLGPRDDAVVAVAGHLLERELRAAIPPSAAEFGLGPWEISLDPPGLRLADGFAEIRVDGHADSGLPLGVGDFTFHVSQRFGLEFAGVVPRLTPLGDPNVWGDGVAGAVISLLRRLIADRLRSERDAYLADANATLREAIPVGQLAEGLAGAGLGVENVVIRSAEVRRDAVLVRLRLRLPEVPRRGLATFTEATGGGTVLLDAFCSWIPGGHVEEFRWHGTASEGVVDLRATTDFVTAAPARDRHGVPIDWCLRVDGVRAPAIGGGWVWERHCRISMLRFVGVLGTRPLPMPVFDLSGPVPRLIAHIDAGASENPPGFAAVVLVTDAQLNGVAEFRDVLAGADPSYRGVVAVPARRATEFLGEELDRLGGLALGENVGGAWAGAVGLEGPGVAILDRGGGVAWSQPGVEFDGLAAALKEHVPEPRRCGRGPAAPVAPIGARAPDFPVRVSDGVTVSGRPASGEPSRIVFVADWATASGELIDELGDGAAVQTVLAVGRGGLDGALPQQAPEDWLLAAVAAEELAPRLGVRCYPSVVELDEGGRVRCVREGATRSRAGRRRRREVAP